MLKNKPKVIELFADDSSHSHFALVGDNGETIWEESGSLVKTKRDQFCIREQVYQHEDPNQPGIAGENIDHALPTNEEQYRKIFQNSIVGMFQTTPEGRFINLNIALAKIFGYDSPKELMSNIQNIQRQIYVNPKDRDLAHELVEKNGFLKNYEVQCSHVSGSIIWIAVNIRKVTDDQGRTLYNEGSVQDITERKRTEKALLKSEEKYRNIFTNSIEGIFQSTSDGRLISANAALANILGYTSPEELIGSITDISTQIYADPTVRGRVKELLIKNGFIKNLEVQCRHKNGGLLWILLNVWRVLDDQGRLLYVEGAGQNITERKRMEEEIQKAQKLESLGVLAGGIAHDFNNLLTGIFGYVDLARSVTREAQAIEYLEETLATIQRTRSLTLQLLTFAKGGAPVQKVMPLAPFIKETVQFALSGLNISCRFSLPENLWLCNIDKNQIGQVIDNIVINATQAMPGGGSIEVSAGNALHKEKEHPLLAEGGYVKISIKDSGIGIPKEILPRIFDPFFTTKIKGHGLGLATCYSIVKRHDGCIDVDSEPGKGTVFHVYLPAATKAVLSTDEKHAATHKGSGTILVMDDEKTVRNALQKMLESLGYNVVSRNNGREAVDFYVSETGADRRFAALFFDLTVPGGMGGKEAVAEIRKFDKEILVFVVSGYADDPIMKNPVDYGFTASISKPFTIAELSEMLNKYLKPQKQITKNV